MFVSEMHFSVLLMLGICLVPAELKPASKSSRCCFVTNIHPHLIFFPQSCHKIVNFLCLQMNILAVLFFSDLLKKQGKLWMMHTSTPEKSELIS